MFDISWSELLILGIVTLVFVGPKELPVFLRTLGRYAGMVRRHANDFKAQFDAAMREAELDSMRKEVEQMQSSINSEVMKAKSTINDAASAAKIEAPAAPMSASAAAPAIQPDTTAPQMTPLPLPPMPASPSEMAAAEARQAAVKAES
ncbi:MULTISPECIES: Sec-independent protein translocase protein TatB [unclassified Hyphomicrobium]|uniref:Sec-independent protein translocase protein TatB n=1 Tax=unclassified Hyphomicrobium TaxID=2619925 RepID=UPI000213E412|nr:MULTISPECIES: Sec-independent protein translocase protein TatB [unclassified Hyphomicrobium]CCB65904.1 Sec-independent protein translocase protein tatB homolog [Hyphomicrobium sp. MC1]